ncbi:2-oxoacid:acceptor oxidoreductase subunit alpha [Nanoarchaeota archaeon]
MPINNLQWKIGGQAGYGIMSAGEIFGKVCSRAGLKVFATNDYPSLVRGGSNTFTVRISEKTISAYLSKSNILVALNQETINLYKHELTENACIIYDENIQLNKEDFPNINLFPIPLNRFAQEYGHADVMRNTVALGASFGLLKLDFNILENVIRDLFAKKPQVIEPNIQAAQSGYNYLKEKECLFQLRPQASEKQMLISSNHAIALGAIKAGLKFAPIYPITPINPLLQYLALKSKDYNYIVQTPEDEISGILQAIGASHAGVRTFIATSGAGFSLMAEAFSFAGIAEIPLVINYGQRAGPATGMPTKTEQSDLLFVQNAGHGEFPRIIVAPGDVQECFEETVRAFQLAEKYQIPTVILTDKFLNEAIQTTPLLQTNVPIKKQSFITDQELQTIEDFKRYQFTETGISPRSIPGQEKGLFTANSDEHEEHGYSSDEQTNRTKMVDKRFQKIETLKTELPQPVLYGNSAASTSIISWGSTKGAILENLEKFPDTNFLQIKYLTPFPDIKNLIQNKKIIVIENNKTGQLARLIKENTLIKPDYLINKYDGHQFTADQIEEELTKCLK